jgi:hypothetical protein
LVTDLEEDWFSQNQMDKTMVPRMALELKLKGMG